MLFCFDVDGTLDNLKMRNEGEYVKGIIPTRILIDLLLDGHKIAIVSPSPFFPEGFESMIYAPNGSNEYRWENVEEAMRFNNVLDKDEVVYIDDLEVNRNRIRSMGILQVFSPQEFLDQLK